MIATSGCKSEPIPRLLHGSKTYLLAPHDCDPPHRVSHPDKFLELAREFAEHGWGKGYPFLVGYELNGRVQLLSGSHRWAAAEATNILIPVVVFPMELVELIYGNLHLWKLLMRSGDYGNLRDI